MVTGNRKFEYSSSKELRVLAAAPLTMQLMSGMGIFKHVWDCEQLL